MSAPLLPPSYRGRVESHRSGLPISKPKALSSKARGIHFRRPTADGGSPRPLQALRPWIRQRRGFASCARELLLHGKKRIGFATGLISKVARYSS